MTSLVYQHATGASIAIDVTAWAFEDCRCGGDPDCDDCAGSAEVPVDWSHVVLFFMNCFAAVALAAERQRGVMEL
jgi:hypothetical protein